MAETIVKSKSGDVSKDELRVRRSIRRTLHMYPNIQVGMLGTHIRPYWTGWREVLEQMILDGEVVREAKLVVTEKGRRINFIHRMATEADDKI